MTSNSGNPDVKIPIEEVPDKNKEILEIICSPNLKHVATLDEDSSISLWTIISQEQLLTKVKTFHIGNYYNKINGKRIFAISNHKYVSISLDRVIPYNFKIFDFEDENEVLLTFPDWQKEIDYLSFSDNGNIIMVNAKYCRAYVFTSNDNITCCCESMIDLKYFKQIYITPKGKLIIFNDTIYEIMMWDIKDLSIKTRVLIDWNYTLGSIEISDDEELLLVCAKNDENNETRLYVFSTETGINLTLITSKRTIDIFHLIASQKGEMLLYISGEKYNLIDPYNYNPINIDDARKLFENKQIQEPYIIQSDKIIYTIDGKLKVKIEKLVPDNWVEYLRKDLEGTNSITAPSKKTIDIIIKIIKNGNDNAYKKEFEGKVLKWSLESKNKSVVLTAFNPIENKRSQIDILPSFYTNVKDFILHCEVLENDDFITFTHIGVIIWTYIFSSNPNKIKMHYYWNDWNDSLVDFDSEKINYKDLLNHFENLNSERILPTSSYKTIYKNLDIKFDLMETFISLNDDKWVRSLGDRCINKCMQENYYFISKISLLSIIIENFNELSKNHHAFLASILSRIAFVIPSTIVNLNSTSPHLSHYGKYYHLSKVSYREILISNLWVHCISFFVKRTKYFNQDSLNNSIILEIPLPNFVSYPTKYNFWKDLLLPNVSPFSHSKKFEMVDEDFYRYLNGEALLEFKWNTYGRKFYFAIWAIYTIFLDLAATISTTITSIYWLINGSVSTWAITFSTLFLEIRFIWFLSAIKFFGIYFTMIINSIDKIISFLIIFGFFTLAFAHSLHLLLRSVSDISQDSNMNIFTQFGPTILASYYIMITGDSTPISSWISSKNFVIMSLITIASFIIVIYLMNILIGVLCDAAINEGKNLAYLALKREIIIQIELLYMLPYQRRRNDWFPFIIFYECNLIKLHSQIIDIKNGKWSGYKEPFVPKYLNEFFLLSEEPPSINDIKKEINVIKKEIVEDLQNQINNGVKNIIDSIKNLKQNE
ncbi:transient receptor potential cation channel subfamily a member 1-like [Gigaspora margarita]|uniref:Transient receptor potential cation channel subfamily a member 1-like n=1 Tax=Gigaspora margarita TaxID=4874 RepID=A0A8H4AQY4_GIGMA|nr:transient receptor potential cation channel subfamily a member 1-like [Gigaspora margarita]